MKAMARLLLIGVPLLALAACGGGTTAPNPPPPPVGSAPSNRRLQPPPPPAVASVAVTPSSATLIAGATTQLTATPRDAQGNPLTGRTVTWTSSLESVATVSTAGLVFAVTPGSAQIRATSEGITGEATVTATPGPVAVVSVTPPTLAMLVGATAPLSATARDARGNLVTGRPITWTSSALAVASVSAGGVVSALAVGTTTMTATVAGIAGTSSVVITAPPANLEIHQINVGWGGSILVRGPDGTTVLLEAGNTGDGTASVVPYLKSVGVQPGQGLDYTIAGHQHCDHVGGLDEVVRAGYDVHRKNYFNGSSNTTSCTDQWKAVTPTTSAGRHVVPVLGSTIPLGNGATLTFLASNGSLIGGGHVTVSDENDRSIAVLIKYGGFDFLWASDLGGGSADNACTGRSTSQTDVETALITAISPGGSTPLISTGGIDVLVANHHGSESSTNSTYMNRTRPTVALIGVGAGQSSNFALPRRSVVENVLLAQAPCVTAPPAVVLQTEEGSPTGAETSFAGFSVGDIRITTDGRSGFTVAASGRVSQGPFEGALAGLPRTFLLDDAMQPSGVARALRVASNGGHW